MSRASTSLDLSEVFNDDDSQGHRLVKFLQKRRGNVRKQNFLFMNCEPQRLSLNVQLEKLPELKNAENCKNNKQQTVNENDKNEGTVNQCDEEPKEKNVQPCTASDRTLTSESNHEANFEEFEVPIVPPLPSELLPSTLAVQQDAVPEKSPILNSLNISKSGQRSPHRPSVSKSGGGDMLRRYSLKRLTKLSSGRRTLLQEFENTIGDTSFQPPLSSTPLSQSQPDKPIPCENRCHQHEADIIKPNSLITSCCHTDTLIKSLQLKDDELKRLMQNTVEKTFIAQDGRTEKGNDKDQTNKTITNTILNTDKSPLKRTYTVEEGNVLGNVILTPANECSAHSPTEPSTSNLLGTSEGHITYQQMGCQPNFSIRMNSNKMCKYLEAKRSAMHQKQEVSHTCPKSSVSILVQSQNGDKAAIQDLPNRRESSIIIQSDIDAPPTIVVPVCQTFNRSTVEEIQNKDKEGENKSRTLPASLTQQTVETTNVQYYQPTEEDNLKLADVLTEDEDETPKAANSETADNNSQTALNLAPRANNIQTKRLRKRQMRLQTNETESEVSPKTENKRRAIKGKHITLNKAPGFPLNGEKFAKELARMSNYEILDLRKRNSMGQFFEISGRRSRRSEQDAANKQQQLDSEIEKELLKRNMDETEQDAANKEQQLDSEIEKELHKRNMDEITDKQQIKVKVSEYHTVPDKFRSSLNDQQEITREYRESSLVDETQTDRVSFKKSEKEQRSARGKNKEMSEVLKQYLEVPKKISQTKTKRDSHYSKRSLYTQGYSDSEEVNNSTETKKKSIQLSTKKRSTLHCIPSPPKSDGIVITNLKILSPPPPLNITLQRSTTQQRDHSAIYEADENLHETSADVDDNIALPPPPPGYENNSDVGSSNFTKSSKTNTSFKTPNTHSTNNNTNNNDIIFKIPELPPTKRKGRRRKINETAHSLQSNNRIAESLPSDNSSTDSTNSTLRRSKRGHVPIGYSIYDILIQQSIDKRMQNAEKKIQKEKRNNKLKGKSNLPISLNNDVEHDAKLRKSKRGTNITKSEVQNKKNVKKTVKRLEIQNKKIEPEKTVETSEVHNQSANPKKTVDRNESFECSHLMLTAPPPVHHLNTVFDQLRNKSCTASIASPSPAPELPTKVKPDKVRHLNNDFDQLRNESCTGYIASPTPAPAPPVKVKPFKVRLARLKNCLPQLIDNLDSVNTVSSSVNGNSNYELISWLKSIKDPVLSRGDHGAIFKDMRFSAGANLSFSNLQGVEYAFYNTDVQGSLGYLRFQPRQLKPRKKAKRFQLHFIVLVGNFRITANDIERRLVVGDMVVIEKLVHYDIENLSEDIGILMVIKK